MPKPILTVPLESVVIVKEIPFAPLGLQNVTATDAPRSATPVEPSVTVTVRMPVEPLMKVGLFVSMATFNAPPVGAEGVADISFDFADSPTEFTAETR
jgi:hypothetical protein